MAALGGSKDVAEVLLEAGASLFTVDIQVINPHFVIKSSQTTQLYITKVINKHFSCQHHIKKLFL
jgi:hypothetical protein